MGLSGFILELLVPGLVAIMSAAVIGWQLGLDNPGSLGEFSGGIVLTALLVISYITGLVIRHAPVPYLPSSNEVYHRRLRAKWPDRIPHLRAHYLPPVSDEVETELTVADVELMIGTLRDQQLSRFGNDSWAEYLMYQWNVARLARNLLIPTGLMAIASVTSAVRNIVDWQSSAFAISCGLLALSVLLIAELPSVYRERLSWHLDILVRSERIET